MLDLKATRHNLHSTTNRFARPDVQQLVRQLRLETFAADGSDEAVELAVRTDLKQRVTDALAEFNGQLQVNARRLKDASEATVSVQIEHEAIIGRVAFRALVDRNRARIEGAEKRFAQIERQLDRFVTENALQDTSPMLFSLAERLLGFAIITVFWLIEAVANGFFFAEGSTGGLFGGVTQAAALSAVNIGVASITSFFILPYTGHVRAIKRMLAIAGVALSVALLAMINLTIAHYRDAFAASPGVDPDIRLVWAGMLQAPFGLQSMSSWLLLTAGLLLAGLAMWKVSGLRDPYPGYGRLAQRHESARLDLAYARSDALDDLQDAHDEAAEQLNERLKKLIEAKEQRQMALQSRERLRQEFTEFLDGIRDDYRRLMAIYQQQVGRPVAYGALETPAIPPFPAEPPFDPVALEQTISAMRAAIRDLDDEHAKASASVRPPKAAET